MRSWRHVRIALLIGILLLGLTHSSPGQAAGGPAEDHASGTRDRITVTLRADRAPTPGQSATLTFEATPHTDAPNLAIRWITPAGVELVGGEAEESVGAVAAGEPVQRNREVRFAEAGTYKIAVEASYSPFEDARFVARGVLFFTVDAQSPMVSDLDPDAGRELRAPVAVTNVKREPAELAPNATADNPCFNVSGSLMRTDKPVTTGGYGTDQEVPVTDFYVELREADPLFDDTVAGAWTDENGNFSFDRFCEGDGLFNDTLELYVWFRAATQAARVTDSSYIDEQYKYESNEVSSDGGTLSFDLKLNEEQSSVFNILDAAGAAQDFWYETAGDNKKIPQVQIHWEPGYGDDGSFYVAFWDEMTIADDPSDPDEWDDVVIMHEYGHYLDDKRGCDDNPGGDHFFTGTYDVELSFGEGYPDYYQSVVRDWRGDSNSNWYIDMLGPGSAGGVNWETLPGNVPNSVRNEAAIAAALWDLYDPANEAQDTVEYGHDTIHDVYTDDDFVNQHFFDDDCDFENFLRAWVDAGQPANGATAAAVNQNTGTSTFPGTMQTLSSQQNKTATNAGQMSSRDYRWWNRVNFVVDKSSSMAGTKFDAVKSVMKEQVNDYSNVSEGTEFDLRTFHAGSSELQTEFAGQFFPDTITPAIDGLTADGSDSGCQVEALGAVAEALEGEINNDVWLYTDGDATADGVEATSQRLTDKSSRASFVLLGGCSTTASTQTAQDEETVKKRRALRNSASTMLGTASLEEAPAGIVPYLLTATKSGGQFLYVGNNQLSDAADILRAQLTHSAGAGKWSDYVSENATYRWDELASWEYNWIDATDGTDWGKPGDQFDSSDSEGSVPVLFSLSTPAFDYYGSGMFGGQVYENGYVTFGTGYEAAEPNNISIPSSDLPNFTVYPFWDDLEWDNRIFTDSGYIPPPGYENHGTIYTKHVGDWVALQFFGFARNADVEPYTAFTAEEFEVLFNKQTNEIRVQYGNLTDGATGATIGIEDRNATDASVQISHNDAAGASDNMGYKFVPVPPQLEKTYTTAVDGTMESVGFLLTGYSGSFDPVVVKYPNGDTVDCNNTADVLCLYDIDPDDRLVQYVQVDVNGRTGDWTATVTPGPSGSGTFSFTSMAASPISPESVGDRTRSTGDSMDVLVDLGQPADGNSMTGYFRTTDGEPFGSSFTLYDDGSHGDGKSGDGVFGASGFSPPDAGSAYLWMEGTVDSTDFVRSDPVPYTFQPVRLTSLGDGVNTGGGTPLEFELRNDDTVNHCYDLDVQTPAGWSAVFYPTPCVNAGQSVVETVTVYMGPPPLAGPPPPNDKPSGTSGLVTVSAVEEERGEMTDSASARVTRRRPPAAIDIFNPSKYLRPGGDTTPLRFYVSDSQGMPVADDTQLTLSTSIGSLPATASVQNGIAEVTFTSGSQEGTATITAETSNGVSATTTVDVQSPLPNGITLHVSPATLSPEQDNATLTATVTDPWGNPVTGETVRIGVEGDGVYGSIDGSEVFTGTTNVAGQVTATFTRVAVGGEAGIRAELLRSDEVVHSARAVITLGSKDTYLPLVVR